METNNKLREALAEILGIADHVQIRFEIPKLANQEISELKQIAEAALAAPARNCERYATLESALAAWREQPPSVGPFDNWLFDYAKESEEAK